MVAIEDERFYEHRGVDFQGHRPARRWPDLIPGGSTQGASTITQQFVKNALEAQGSRTVFQKFRESALAYHLERQWDKDKILTQYLNTIYFGEGAYGIEAAARTYFGWNHPGCGESGADPCASELLPEEAAMLAGIISSPSAYSPRANPQAALDRRNLVLQKMHDQGDLSDERVRRTPSQQPCRPRPRSRSPRTTPSPPTSPPGCASSSSTSTAPDAPSAAGSTIHTLSTSTCRRPAKAIAYNTLAGIEPTASVVVIDNKTGGVKAMVGGNDFDEEPFNLATNGHRQPGSSFKPFTLITAFENGFGPGSTFPSAPQEFSRPELQEGGLRGRTTTTTSTTAPPT